MPKKYRHYSQEFKLEAVKLITESGKPAAVVARELGIDSSSLYRWRDELDPGHVVHSENGVEKRSPKPNRMSQEEEIRALRRQNEVLRQERDFLKKAAAFFAKESR